MRLSSKIFVALAVLAGSIFGFSPDASAHKNTGTAAVVTGTVRWPAGVKSTFNLTNRGAQNFGGASSNADSLSLDLRAGNPNSPLNGCRVKTGNQGNGLPVGDATSGSAYTTSDLCFKFDSVGFQILAAGLWDGLEHKTLFACAASGTTGASGNDKESPPRKPSALTGPTFGASYGEFTCDGAAPPGSAFLHVPSADGHFHLISPASTVVGFLGEIHCTVAGADGTACPKNHSGNQTSKANGGHTTPLSGADHNNSRIKHTVACKGDVTPIEFGSKFVVPPLIDTVTAAAVTLTCVIG